MKKKKINPFPDRPPFPVIPQVWNMLHKPVPMTYFCDLCQEEISEDQYDHNDGLCPTCVAKYA